jgi:hypothetical protein
LKDRPSGSPPDVIPRLAPRVRAIDAGAIRGAMFKMIYVWLEDGQSFWFFPTYVGRESVAGFRWGRFGWTYAGFDLRLVKGFSA